MRRTSRRNGVVRVAAGAGELEREVIVGGIIC